MATRPKKFDSKKPAKKKTATPKPAAAKVATAKVSEAAVRGAPAPEPGSVLVNAIEPSEKLPKGALNHAVDTFQESLKAALPAAAAVNRKLVDIAQTNMNAGLELARDLAGAKTPMEAVRLQMDYWHDNAGVFQSQAQELRTLSAEFLSTASEPIRAHMRRA